MKKILIILMFILVSCSQTKVVDRNVAASGMPARIVKVLSPDFSTVEYSPSLQLKVKIQAFKFGSAVAKDRDVSFELVSGKASLDKSSAVTNDQGEAEAKVSIKNYPTELHVKVRVDNVIRNIQVQVTKPEKFLGSYSLKETLLSTSVYELVADGKSKVKFDLQIVDEKGRPVDAYGLDVKLIELSGDSYAMEEKAYGLYSYNYQVGTEKGKKVFKAKIADSVLPREVELKFLPDLEFVPRFLIPQQTKTGTFEVLFAVKEKTGAFLKSTKELSATPILEGGGTYSKVTYDEEQHRFKYVFYPPQKSGETKVGVKFNGKEYWATKAFQYEYSPIVAANTKLMIEEKKIIPTGIDFLNVSVTYFDSENNIQQVTNTAQFPKFNLTGEAKIVDLKADEKGVFKGKLVPGYNQRNLKVELLYESKVIAEKNLKFDFKTPNEKITNERSLGSGTYFNGLNFQVQNREGWKDVVGQVIGFGITNDGGNEIVPHGCAKDSDSNDCQATREYEFEFQNQAKQNMVMTVTDFPSDTLSKMMHGWFFFFPRKVVPHIEYSEDKSQIILTLPTDEKVYFDAASKQIVGGVMDEGPIDLGPSRHTRTFPLVRYKGYGTILRINARGQDARLGNWNKTKISGDFGNVGAEGVMIYQYNSQTGKPDVCYAAKKDFWPQEDINPIPFKYYSDEDFAAYIKSHCNFNLTSN